MGYRNKSAQESGEAFDWLLENRATTSTGSESAPFIEEDIYEWLREDINSSTPEDVWEWITGLPTVRSEVSETRMAASDQGSLVEALRTLQTLLETEASGVQREIEAGKFFQEVLDQLATEKKEDVRAVLEKLLKLSEAVDNQDRTAIPALLEDFVKEKSILTFSQDLAIELATRLHRLGLTKESETFRRHAFALLAEQNVFLRHPFDKEEKKRDLEVDFWTELIRQATEGLSRTDAAAARSSLDQLLKLVQDVRTVLLAYPDEVIRKEREYDGPLNNRQKVWPWSTFENLFGQLGLLLIGMQRLMQVLLDAALSDLESGKGFDSLNAAQDALESKIQPAVFPTPNEEVFWRTDVTRSEFTKKGGLHLDFFLDTAAARIRSAAISFYDENGENGSESWTTFDHIFRIRVRQIAFLRRLYGAPDPKTRLMNADSEENKALIGKMRGHRFRLHNNDDWREFLQLKFGRLISKTGPFSEEALLGLVNLLQTYFQAFTFHTQYNILDDGPEKANYLTKEFPRTLGGQIIHDCGVYALRTIYALSLVRRDADLLFQLVFLPAHVGVIYSQVGRVDGAKKQFSPLFIQQNAAIFHVGNLIELARIRNRWQTFTEPVPAGDPPKPLPAGVPSDDLQFLGELAAPAYIPGPVDMPFRLKEVPDDPKLTPDALKSKLWAFYKDEAKIEIFGDETRDPKSDVFQAHLMYVKLIQDFKNFVNGPLRDFWNVQGNEFWKTLQSNLQDSASQGKKPAAQVLALLKDYREKLTKGRGPIDSGKDQIARDEKEVSEKLQSHPKLKKAGIRITFGLRAATIPAPSALDILQELETHIKKLDQTITTLETQKEEVLIAPMIDALRPLFATDQGFLESVD